MKKTLRQYPMHKNTNVCVVVMIPSKEIEIGSASDELHEAV